MRKDLSIMMKGFFAAALFLTCIPLPSCSSSQTLTKLTGPYLGQKPPGMTAALFAPGYVSTGYFEHSSPAFSPDGGSVFWSVQESDSFEHKRPIVCMERSGGAWTRLKLAPFVQTQYHYDHAFFSVDGKRIYFHASLADEKDHGLRTCDLWYVERTASGWSEQRKLPSPPNSDDMDGQPSVDANGSIYFTSRYDESPDGFGLYYSAFRDGAYQAPVLMDGRFNIKDGDWTPYIAPDESFFMFCSFRKGGFGSGDLYISFKRPDGVWGDPINMGPRINTEGNERFPMVTPDGKYLFFNSTRKIAGAGPNEPGNGAGDVYWIDAKVIEELRPKASK